MRRLRRWLVPAILAVGAVAGAAVAWASEAAAPHPSESGAPPSALATPLLSVRRVPEVIAAPTAERRLLADLEALMPSFPPGTCLAVTGPDLAYGHRADAPMAPASTQKLLTATAAIEVLDPAVVAGGLPLLHIVERLIRDSDNNATALLLQELGRTTATPTTAGGVAVVTEVIAEVGAARVVDGTGLSLENRVTCQLLVDLLTRPVTGELLSDRLAVAGESGTLAERFVDTPLEGVLRAKTGSLTSVASLAGIVEDDDPPLTFAFIVNAAPPAAVPREIAALQQRVLEVLASWPRVPDASVLGP